MLTHPPDQEICIFLPEHGRIHLSWDMSLVGRLDVGFFLKKLLDHLWSQSHLHLPRHP